MNLQAEVNAMDAMVVARINGRDVTRGELSVAFDRVADPTNWKNPICKSVVLHGDVDEQIALTREAVRFFAGCDPTFTRHGPSLDGERVHFMAVGYYIAVGA